MQCGSVIPALLSLRSIPGPTMEQRVCHKGHFCLFNLKSALNLCSHNAIKLNAQCPSTHFK